MNRVTRGLALLFALTLLASGAGADPGKRVIVLGFDGMDYDLTRRLLSAGELPHLAELARTGNFQALGTAVPPQSPVAWSNFITGMDAGGHGIFDFVHRDPETLIPYLSTSRTEEGGRTLRLGKYQIPLSGGGTELLRHGEAFWEVLERNGIETTIMRMPANYPPSGTAHRELSGMGTPDILGTYGTFSFYTYDASGYELDNVSGGTIHEVTSLNHVVKAEIEGPDNPFYVKRTRAACPFRIYLDPESPVAKVEISGESLILEQGEWSAWVPITFDLIRVKGLQTLIRWLPGTSARGMVRFYLKEVRPTFQLYATPVNFDPLHPAAEISHPGGFAAELAEASGRFYTQGMPEDTHALGEGVFDYEEFLAQAAITGEETIAQYEAVLEENEDDFLFYYFGNLDQVCHMLWRPMDPGHPAYDAATDSAYADAIPSVYRRLDDVVGYTLERIDPETTTLIVMSDHGFTSFRRSFHLNAWLRDQGYLAVRNPHLEDDPGFFTNVDWTRTRAYALGLNGLYLNLRGRERYGIVRPENREELMEEIAGKLLATLDPATGEPPVTKVYHRERDYHDRGNLEIGPDLVVGYAKMTRSSNESAKGAVSPGVFTDNTEFWSGDHCMDHEAVPGILFSNRPLTKPATALDNLAESILAEFGIEWKRTDPGTEE